MIWVKPSLVFVMITGLNLEATMLFIMINSLL